MPVARVLIGAGDTEEHHLGEGPRNELQARRQPVRGESCWHADGGQPKVVERCGTVDEQRKDSPHGLSASDIRLGERWHRDAQSGREQDIASVKDRSDELAQQARPKVQGFDVYRGRDDGPYHCPYPDLR